MQGSKAAIVPALRRLCGQVIGERYRLEELLAVGGMGAVFRARHLQLERDVAVKLLRPDLSNNRDVCARLQREAKLSSRLDHPNCVRMFDFGTTAEGTRFLVMELLRGRDLASLLRAPLMVAHAVEITAQILEGLDHAHRRGVLHRDIKPGNIRLVNDDDGRTVVKVCDFGIAKGVGSGQPDTIITQIGMIFGTPVYMSPEQAAGHEIDHRADIYSAGVVLFEMLTGLPPFQDPDPLALLNAKMAGQLAPLPNVPPPIVAVVHQLLAVQRQQRYAGAGQAAVALRTAIEQSGLPMVPPPREWGLSAGPQLPQDEGADAPMRGRSDTSILRAFGAGLDKVLHEPTPHAAALLVSGIHSIPSAASAADRYIDMDNLQLQELGGDDDDEPGP